MKNKPFFIDPSDETLKLYSDLENDSHAVTEVPAIYHYRNCYELFVLLLATIENNSRLVLADGSRLNEDELEQGVHSYLNNRPPSIHSRGESGWTHQWGKKRLEMSHCEVGLMTSGTTGIPKKVFHTMQSLVRSVQEASKHQSDVWGLTYTPTRLAGLQVFFQALANQNTIVRLFGLTPSAMHDAIEEYQVTHLSATPTFFRLLACDGTVHRKVERITFGGEVVDERTISAVCGTFPNAGFKNIYASTEAGSLIMSDSELFNVHPDESHLFQVFGGELAVHRSLLATSLQSSVDGDYYLTGDCVEIVQANPLIFRIVGRRDDFINVGGNKVSPYRIEALLREMPEIRLAKVYGIPNSVTGSLVVCDLVLNDGMQLTAQEVIAELKTRLPLFAVPRIVNFRTEIDVTITGKQSRHQ